MCRPWRWRNGPCLIQCSSSSTGGRSASHSRGSPVHEPVSGEIVAVNGELTNSPELINEDPYDEGWIFQVRVAADSVELLSAAEYTNLTSDDS